MSKYVIMILLVAIIMLSWAIFVQKVEGKEPPLANREITLDRNWVTVFLVILAAVASLLKYHGDKPEWEAQQRLLRECQNRCPADNGAG